MNFMAAKDVFHQQVRQALEKDGWTITADPLSLRWLGTTLQIDLGAERLIAAERGEERIAVEIKTFIGASAIADLENALGQFVLYRSALKRWILHGSSF
jgi:XisH protein